MADLERLNKSIKELEKQSTELKEFNAVYAELNKLKSDVEKNIFLIKQNNAKLVSVSEDVAKQLAQTERQINELFTDNKSFQKELDTSLNARLERYKSDIQVEIRNEGAQVQRSLEAVINSHFNQFEYKLIQKIDNQTSKIRFLTNLIYLLLGVSLMLSIIPFLIR
ncbi:MAG: hypothetical protein WDO14_20320 [Bacteroidota bacterium]